MSNRKKQTAINRRSPSPRRLVNLSNELRLKQIYESSHTNQLKKNVFINSPNARYQLPIPQSLRNQPNRAVHASFNQQHQSKSNRYKSFLEGHILPQPHQPRHLINLVNINKEISGAQAHTDRHPNAQDHHKKRQKQMNDYPNKPRLSSVYNLKKTQLIQRSNNQSVDFLKARQKKIQLQNKNRQSYMKHRAEENENNTNQGSALSMLGNQTENSAKTLYRQGHYHEALKVFEQNIQKQPEKADNYYYSAIILLNKKKFLQGFEYLNHLITNHPLYRKTIYLFAAIACKNLATQQDLQQTQNANNQKFKRQKKKTSKKINQIYETQVNLTRKVRSSSNKIEEAIDICSLGLKQYPNYVDLLVYRGKLLQIKKRYQEAHKNFQQALKHKQDHVQALIKDANCLKALGAVNHAISQLNMAYYIQSQKNNSKSQNMIKTLQARIEIYLQTQKLVQAKKDIEKLVQIDPDSSETYLYKGLLYNQQGNKKQAILAYQQCLTSGNSKQAMQRALIQITKSKIDDRDFYSALHHINRSEHLQLNKGSKKNQIQIFRLYTEGVVFLMKRKIKQGIDNFNKILKLYGKPIIKTQQTKSKSKIKLEKNHEENYEASLENYPYICKMYYLYRAFGYFMLSEHQKAIEDYKTSQKYLPKSQSTTYNQLIAQGITKVKQKDYRQAFVLFNKAQHIMPHKVQPYVYRSATYVEQSKGLHEQIKSIQKILTGLKELDQAQQLNEPDSNMLFFRSLIYMYLGKVDEGLQDIVKAISKSEENVPKYFFYRSLAHNALNNKKQALNDLNICINLDENYGLAYFQRAKINFYNLNIAKGLEDLKRLKSIYDYGIVKQQGKEQLKSADPVNAQSLSRQIYPYCQSDIHYHQFWLCYSLKMIEQAEQTLPKISNQQIKKKLKTHLLLKSCRIKQAKQLITGQADRLICDIILDNKINQKQIQNIHNIGLKTEEKIKKNNSKKVNEPTIHSQAQKMGLEYFSIVHYYTYLGVLCFKLGDYYEAINNFTLAQKERSLMDLQQNISNNPLSQQLSLDQIIQSQQFTSSSASQSENSAINFNLLICYLKIGQHKKAYQTFVRDILPLKESLLKSEEVAQFSHLLFKSMKNNGSSNKIDATTAQKISFNLQIITTYLAPLSKKIQVSLHDNIIVGLKLCYLVPYPSKQLKAYKTTLNPDFILSKIRIQQVQNRPQPPWVKKTSEGLVFTDEVRNIDIEFLTTLNDDNEQQQQQGEQEEQEQQQQDENDSESQQQEVIDIKKFKDKMKLDDDIQKKLQRILQKKKAQQ